MPNSDFPDGKAILDSIKKDSKARRAAPLEFFKKFLTDIWMDNTPEEAILHWKDLVEHGPWYADDALYCMDAVISSPPPDLVDILNEFGWISLTHDPDETGEEAEYSLQEYLDWLISVRNNFRDIYEIEGH